MGWKWKYILRFNTFNNEFLDKKNAHREAECRWKVWGLSKSLLWRAFNLIFNLEYQMEKLKSKVDVSFSIWQLCLWNESFAVLKIYHFLMQDPKKSTKIWKDLYKNKKKKDRSSRDLEIFGNLAIYLRKWVSECFAGIYGGQTLLLLWDFCFMHEWSQKILYKIGLVSSLFHHSLVMPHPCSSRGFLMKYRLFLY